MYSFEMPKKTPQKIIPFNDYPQSYHQILCSINHPHRWKNNAPRRSKTNKNQHGQGKTGFYL